MKQGSPAALAVTPIDHPLSASVRVPGSKSMTNRALLVAALAEGTTTLSNALDAGDTRLFVAALRDLGFIVVHRPASRIQVTGLGGRVPATEARLFVGNAGTAARFLTALLTLGHGEYTLDGDERMGQRPIGGLLASLRQLGAIVESRSDFPPVRVTASGLPGGRAEVAGEVSSQFLSGLLMVAPYAAAPVELVVQGGLNSRPYVDMTLAVMSDFGAEVERDGYERFRVRPQHYQARTEYRIESDASAASFFFAAPAVCGGRVRVQDISRSSRQGDVAFLDVLAAMGCSIAAGDDWIEVTGPPGELRGIDADLRDLPDTAPTLAAIAPFAATPTTIRGIASARVKESDRVAALYTQLTRLGVAVEERPDGLVIQPCRSVRPAAVETYDDHRLAMAFALVGLRVAGVTIENAECVSKTFPGYFDTLNLLRSRTAEPAD